MPTANTPIKIGTKICRNRLTMAPTVKFMAGDDGLVTDDYVSHYEERARHGVGLIVVEATCIAKEARLYPTQLGLWNDEQIDGHSRIAAAAHKHGALIIPQIHHGGLGTHPDCGPLTSPTQVEWDNGYFTATAIELSVSDIQRITQEYIDAAIRAKKAGYDGVQLHACHGYLINDFASEVNKRTDEYGGSALNRARFGSDIIAGIRKACGKDFIISARISGCDPTLEDALIVAEAYVSAGCDYLQVSCGIGDFSSVEHDDSLPYNKIAALGVRMHKHFAGRIPVSTVNGLRTPQLVRYMLENELVDTVDLGCGLLADPAFCEAILSDAPYTGCFNCPSCAFGPEHLHPCPAMHRRGVSEFGLG